MISPLDAVTLGLIIGTAVGAGWLIGTIQDNTPSAIPVIISPGSDQAPARIDYYPYPYGPNGTTIDLPIHRCWPAWNLWARDMLKYPDWFVDKDGMICHQEYH